jgi:hypothetical protein
MPTSCGSRARIIGGALGVLWCLWVSVAVAAASRGLDPSFGSGGIVRTGLSDDPARVAAGGDGSIVLQYPGGIYDFLSNGDLNPRFGERGFLSFPSSEAGVPTYPGLGQRPFELSSVDVDGSGRVLLFGTALSASGKRISIPRVPGIPSVAVSKAAVIRLGTDGVPDPSFGSGRGVSIGRFGLRSPEPGRPQLRRSIQALDGAVDSQDRPVLLAGVTGVYGPCIGHSTTAPLPRAVVRMTATGVRDVGFGSDGVSLLRDMSPLGDPSLALDGADRPLATGFFDGGCSEKRLVVRLGADGHPLSSFGGTGRRLYRKEFDDLAPSGEMFMTSAGGSRKGRADRRLFAFNPNGGPDEKFGDEGAIVPPGLPRGVLSLGGVDAAGRLLLVGGYRIPSSASPGEPGTGIIAIERRLPDGAMDPSFGDGGRLLTSIPDLTLLGTPEALLDPQGRLLVVVSVRRQGQTSFELLLMRFLVGTD